MLSSRVPEPKLFSLWQRERSSSSPVEQSSVAGRLEAKTARSSRYILPQGLNTAIQQLDDQELERLVLAALAERARRKKPPLPDQGQRKRHTEAVTVSLPQGKLNAVRAAFKAGVTPSRIAKEFGISRQDVQSTLAGYTRTR